MALDTRGIVDGFMRGYQFVDNVKQRQRNNERQDRLDQERSDYRDWQMNRAEERDAANAEHRQWQRDSTDDMNQLRAEQIGLQMDLSRNAEGRAQRQEGRQQQAFDAQQKRIMGQEVFASLANGAPLTEEHQAFIESNPQFDPRKFYDTRFHSSLDRLTGILEDKNIDEDELTTLNRPDFLDDVNRVYRDVINKGEGGNKRISRIYPSDDPGKVFFELEVTGEDGKTYRAPVTEGRDSNPDANVMPVDIGTAIEHLAGYNKLSQSIRQMNTEERGNFLKFGQDMGYIKPAPKKSFKKLNDNAVFEETTGEVVELGAGDRGHPWSTDGEAKLSNLTSARNELGDNLSRRLGGSWDEENQMFTFGQDNKNSAVIGETIAIAQDALEQGATNPEALGFPSRASVEQWALDLKDQHGVDYKKAKADAEKAYSKLSRAERSQAGNKDDWIEEQAAAAVQRGVAAMRAAAQADIQRRTGGGDQESQQDDTRQPQQLTPEQGQRVEAIMQQNASQIIQIRENAQKRGLDPEIATQRYRQRVEQAVLGQQGAA